MRSVRLAWLCWLVPAVAAADPPPAFEVRDRGDAVEIIAHDMQAARTSVSAIRSRLEIPVVGHPSASRVIPGDTTVRVVELASDDSRTHLSVKLNYEHPEVVELARYAQPIQVGADLHLIVPRRVPVEGANVALPGPTLPHAPAMPSAIEAPAAPAHADHPAPPPATPTVAAVAPKPPVRDPLPGHDTPVPPNAPPATASDADSSGSSFGAYAAFGLAAIGAGVWLVRRRRAPADATSIDIVAQRSLGNRARVVWMAAGSRELLVAVTGQQVRVLDHWRKSPAPAQLPVAQTHAERGDTAASPAIAGLLKLRDKAAPRIDESVATGDVDADALWASEILAATRGRR